MCLELERIVGEQGDAPFPVVEADGAGDDLFDFARVCAADHAVGAHHFAALLHRQHVPVVLPSRFLFIG